MGTAPRLSQPDSVQDDGAASGRSGSELPSGPSYARDLRVVGQMLESHDVLTADLVYVADTYIIQGQVKPNRRSSFTFSSLRNWTKRVKSGLTADPPRQKTPAELVTLRCTLEDVFEFDARARCRRTTANKMPDPYALSQILRSAGAYLDTRKRSSLIGILLREREITIRFESGEGRLEETRRDVDYFYDYWVKMYLRRNERHQPDSFKAALPAFLQNEMRSGSN